MIYFLIDLTLTIMLNGPLEEFRQIGMDCLESGDEIGVLVVKLP
jgi:hypothetical protein